MVAPENGGSGQGRMMREMDSIATEAQRQMNALGSQAANPPVSQQLINTMARNNEQMAQLLGRLHNFIHAFKGTSPELRIQEPSSGERVATAGVFNVMAEHMMNWDKCIDDLGTLVEEIERF